MEKELRLRPFAQGHVAENRRPRANGNNPRAVSSNYFNAEFFMGHVAENRRPRANVNNPRAVSSNYFNAEFFMVLLCLTVSLLILPLVLPPLPPPPLMLLLLPIGVLVLLILAFMPSDVRNIASTCNETCRFVPYELH